MYGSLKGEFIANQILEVKISAGKIMLAVCSMPALVQTWGIIVQSNVKQLPKLLFYFLTLQPTQL